MTIAVEIKQLAVQFSSQQVLEDISLSIPKNKMIGLVGPNGSGKTTLLNCLGGLHKQYRGSIQIADLDIKQLSQRQIASQVSYLHQHMPAQLHLTVWQVVELGLIPKLSPWSAINSQQRKTIAEAIDRVGLKDMSERSFISLSGGEKQRVLIAKTIVQQTELILMDEPTNHLDIKHQIEILQLVKSLQLTTITCIHDINLALSICDEIICLQQGKLAFIKPPAEIDAEDFKSVYGVDCLITPDPFHNHPQLSVKWGN